MIELTTDTYIHTERKERWRKKERERKREEVGRKVD